MQTTLALAAIAAVANAASLGAVTGNISPSGSPPAGFSTTFDGKFQITAVNSTIVTKRDLSKRDACPTAAGSLVITLTNGKLTDQNGRTGYIASNFQFQFDAPPQAGAIYTDGFSVGSNSSLALGPSAIFYECLSGGFYNLYDRHWAAQCAPILIDILPCGTSSPGAVTQASDGQPAVTTVATAVSQISDGQPQAQSAKPITQISDGQPQAASAIPITQISDGQPQVPTAVISQINDGQPQAPTSLAVPAPAISQISDGQPQAPTATLKPAPISQISDGQPQAPTATPKPAPISQISDGQPQAPTSAAGAVISQISDGQPQAPTTVAPAPVSTPAGAVISQISDGQIQAPNATLSATPTAPAPVTVNDGNVVAVGSSLFAVVVGLAAALL